MVPGSDGTVVQWGFETASPGALLRRGWSHSSIKPGDKIAVSFHTSKNGSTSGNVTQLVLPDNNVLTAEDLISHPPGAPTELPSTTPPAQSKS